jgi:ribonucleoside-diphosphate reductase alpha chain
MDFNFKTTFARDIFYQKYAQGGSDSWPLLAARLVDDVCGTRNGTCHPLLSVGDRAQLTQYIIEMKFVPGGRYLYYAGRPLHFFNNCFAFNSKEDTREAWSEFIHSAMSALMSGGGIGNCYSVFRPEGSPLGRTGGLASGPIPLALTANEVGRNVMQGGSRRSAIYGSLHWWHKDIDKWIELKDYPDWIKELKAKDFNYPAPMDMTNMSVNWDTKGLTNAKKEGTEAHRLWYKSVEHMLRTAEPGFSINHGKQEAEVARNACAEFISEDDGDICNLGSVNFGALESISELKDVTALGAKFLICGSIRGDVPLERIRLIREKNRSIGLGIMGVHEWLLRRQERYEMTSELRKWMQAWRFHTRKGADEQCDRFFINRPKRYNAIAPAGSIGILAGTTTGIEPLFAPAYKRRYLRDGSKWVYQNVIEPTAKRLISDYGIDDPDSIDCAYSLSYDYERRIKFQADMQDFVDMGISSTCNMPAWGTPANNETTVQSFGEVLLKYAPRLRGFTAYSDGCRGGQPMTVIPYSEAIKDTETVYEENEESCKGGVCGV